MDDVNINEICLDIEEVEENTDGDEWIKLNWIKKQNDNDTASQSEVSSEVQKDSHNEVAQIKDNDSKVSNTNTEPEDISDGISVITESDTDTVNTNFFQICQFDNRICRPLRMLETQVDIKNILIACVLGIIIGLVLSRPFIVPEACPISHRTDTEGIEIASRNIINTCKELTEVKTVLNEIKGYIPVDKKIMKNFLTQFLGSTNSFNRMNNMESFNPDTYSLHQLQVSLQALSSLAFIYDNHGSLKSNMNKTLDIVNGTKAFHETLIQFKNNSLNVHNSIGVGFLLYGKDNIHITSEILLFNLIKMVNKVTLNVYNKYAKERDKMIRILCELRTMLSDEFLQQLTETNHLFKNYKKYCSSNYTSKKSNSKTTTKENAKINNIKKKIKKADTTLHMKYDKKNVHKINDSDRKSSSENKKNKTQNMDNSDTMNNNVHDDSPFFSWSIIERMRQLRRQLKKKLHHLNDILLDIDFFSNQIIENRNEMNDEIKKPVNSYKRESDYLQSIGKDGISKNSFNNIFMQPKDTCPLSTNYCPKFNINTDTFDATLNHETESYIINSNNKHNTKSRAIVLDHENFVKIRSAERKYKPKQKDYFKSSGFTKKSFNENVNIERKNEFSQDKIKNHVPEHTIDYHKSKRTSFNNRASQQDNQRHINTDGHNVKRSRTRKKQRQRDTSDWYFQRAHSRKNMRSARKYAEYAYTSRLPND